MRAIRLFALFVLIATFAIGLVSCGGNGGQSPASGRLRLTVQWPSTRDIPPATRSLKATAKTLVKNSAGQKIEDVVVGTKVLARPEGQSTSTMVLDDLPSVEVRVRVQAFTSSDGTGTPIAQGSKDVVIAEEQTTSASITLASDIASIAATPTSLTLSTSESKSITMVAKEANGATVNISDSRWSYTSSNPAIATVSKRPTPNGHVADVVGVAAGSTSIQVQDTTTGVSVTVPVTVQASAFCSSYFASAEGHTDTGFEDASVSGAYGFPHASFVSIFGGGSAEGHAKSYVRVNAPTRTSPFTIPFTTQIELKDENPDGLAANSGTVTITWPGGSDSASSFFEGVRVKSHTMTVQHGQVLLIDLRSTGSCGTDTGVTAIGDLIFDEPNDVELEVLTCGVDE